MQKPKKGRKVALVAGLALVVLSVVVVWTFWGEIRSWYVFRRDFEGLGKNEQGYPEYQHGQTGIVFVGLPGGTFEMGGTQEEFNRHVERSQNRWRLVLPEIPQHEVRLSPFLVAKYEVTQAQWEKVMGDNPSEFEGDTLPVEDVSWEDCQEFCEKTGLSLPTEAQWEYACRAGTSGAYSGTGNLDDMGWYEKNRNGIGPTHPVGQKQPNHFGLFDMHGNVMEWCEDVYDKDFYPSPEATQKNPICTSGSEDRVIRGGYWSSRAADCRSASRESRFPASGTFTLGFRPTWSPP